MKVLKFGGTSVGKAESIRKVAAIIGENAAAGEPQVVVVSALSQVTNRLIRAAEMAAANDEQYQTLMQEVEQDHIQAVNDLIGASDRSAILGILKKHFVDLEDLMHGVFLLRELSPRSLDLIQSFGERLSANIIATFLSSEGLPASYCDARKFIRTDGNFGAAKVDFFNTNAAIRAWFEEHSELQIVTGFCGSTEQGQTTTLGRGGSDYTASILGAALEASLIEIWTDVDGVMTADPRRVRDAFSLSQISYEEAMELSHFGAKVIYPPTIQPVYKQRIPIRIRNTFNLDFPGTLISHEPVEERHLPVKGISSIGQISLVSLIGAGMVGVPGISHKLFGALAGAGINVILITQASSEHSICFAVAPQDGQHAREVAEEAFELEIMNGKIERVVVEEELSIVAIIGSNMRHSPGISHKLFRAMGRNGINVSAIAQGSSELNVSVAIREKDLAKALNALHQEFFLSDTKVINLFLVGTGLIGSTLLDQIEAQQAYLMEEKGLKIQVVALANSRNAYINEEGVSLADWRSYVDKPGKGVDMQGFIDMMVQLNLPNTVFVDCTSSEKVIPFYQSILSSAISIVTPNKLANSSALADYINLQQIAAKNNVQFLYETNVGAGLPVIGTLQGLKHSGDRIVKIEGILSGTLSYIFNNFTGDSRFVDIVRVAREKGYTEPDPRDDLNGMDVARKILILSREAGIHLEPEDVSVQNIMPRECMEAPSVDAFFEELEKADAYFAQLKEEAASAGKVLRFIASMESGKAQVRLESVGPEHPFFSLSGSDNIISFTTARYKETPLVIKGPGAGAEVTAAGVFAEIITISNHLSGD